jgi:thiol-disulfide isomerase/thioredoxin
VQGAVVPAWTQLRGHVVVLEFWASWCMACRALAPTLNDWHAELNALGVHILGVTMDPFEEAVRASEALSFPTYSDEDGTVTMRYQGTALPTLVLVDKQGVVVDVMIGVNFEQLSKFEDRISTLAGTAP